MTPPEKPLKLRAEDAKDLEVVSAMLQDAITSVGEMTYQRRARRFVAMLSRYARERGEGVRVRSALKVEGVLGVRSAGVDQTDKRGLLPLLALTAEEKEDGACRLTLAFAGGGMIQLDAECLDAAISDVGPSWRTPRRPRHSVDA